jgi:hypothetical protein
MPNFFGKCNLTWPWQGNSDLSSGCDPEKPVMRWNTLDHLDQLITAAGQHLRARKTNGDCPVMSYSIECESHTGPAQICGWTGFRPDGNTQDSLDPTAPWQYRKWRKKSIQGWYEFRNFYGIGCTACVYYSREEYQPADLSVGCDGEPETTIVSYFLQTDGCDNPALVGTGAVSYVFVEPLDNIIAHTLTSRIISGTGDCFDYVGFDLSMYSYRPSGSVSEILIEEIDIAEEIVAQNPTPDAIPTCCASTSSINTLPSQATLPLAIGTSTAVKLHFTASGWPPNTNLRLTLTYQINGDPNPANYEVEQITVTTDAAGEIDQYFYIEQPRPPVTTKCLISHSLEEIV